MTVLIQSKSDNTYFNLAAEEYFLHQRDDDIIFIYTNRPAVVIGKHQNVYDECRVLTCKEQNVDVARRLSGGGTVYHGSGNINFCFIKNLKDNEPLVDFKKHLEPIIGFLRQLGLPAEFSGRNDLLLNGFKISGNAEHVFQKKRRLIHHGTLLFDANLLRLKECTAPKKEIKFISHAVKSVRSQVVNISDYLLKMNEQTFVQGLSQYLLNTFTAQEILFTEDEIVAINKLAKEKYEQWDWIYAYSPAFEAITTGRWQFFVRKGFIEKAIHKDIEVTHLKGKLFEPETFQAFDSEKIKSWF